MLTIFFILFISTHQDKYRFNYADVKPINWCHGFYDFVQFDSKTMCQYNDTVSRQCRYCGTDLPPDYTSDSNVLLITMKTNSDEFKGTGFKLRWTVVSGMYLKQPIMTYFIFFKFRNRIIFPHDMNWKNISRFWYTKHILLWCFY